MISLIIVYITLLMNRMKTEMLQFGVLGVGKM